MLTATGASGDLDLSFDPGTNANGSVEDIVVQPDGRLLIAGEFGIARLHSDGGRDTSFDPGAGTAGATVTCIALQPDGRVLVGGWFTAVKGTNRNRIARLDADGSLDTSFDPGTGADAAIQAIVLQPDGKMLIGGWFTTVDGTNRNGVARLHANGSLDTSFDPGTGANDWVDVVALQADGKVIVGGRFTTLNGTNRSRIARLNADGGLDTGFIPGTGATGLDPWGFIGAVLVQTDGNILIGGGFTAYNGVNRNGIARLHANGGLDADFDPGTGVGVGIAYWLRTLVLQPDGKLIVGGLFDVFNGVPRTRLARLQANGSLDDSFNPTLSGINPTVYSLALQPDGRVLLGGFFPTVNGTSRTNLARLQGDPVPQPVVVAWGNNTYGQTNVPAGLSNVVALAGGGYHCLALRGDGTVVGWGDNRFGQTTIPRDLTNAMAVASGTFHNLALRQDGTLVAWGGYPDSLGGVLPATVPPALSNLTVRAIAAGDQASLALLADGTVTLWTLAEYQPLLGGEVTGISCGGNMNFFTNTLWNLGLRTDGTVVGWGYNEDGQIDTARALSNVVAISAGGVHALALDGAGTVTAWGRNHRGQTNVPSSLSNVVAVAAGAIHSLVLRGDGTVVAWGAGETNTGTNLDYGQSMVPAGLSNVVAISAGVHFSVALLGQAPIPDPRLEIAHGSPDLELRAHGTHGIPSQLLRASRLEGPWLPTMPVTFTNASMMLRVLKPDAPAQFFRLRRQ